MNILRICLLCFLTWGACCFASLSDTLGADILPESDTGGISFSWDGPLREGEPKEITVRVHDERHTIVRWMGGPSGGNRFAIRFIVQHSDPTAPQRAVSQSYYPRTWSTDAGLFEEAYVPLEWDDGLFGTITIIPCSSMSQLLVCKKGIVADNTVYVLATFWF